MSPLKWLFMKLLKLFRVKQKCDGFTLVELLVGIVIATLVVTPLLGFMMNIMTTDRQEQAKANTEQEIKAALDYIARDLQQAIYIYDTDGINAIRRQLRRYGDKNDFFPVLVFWKREFILDGLIIESKSDKRDDTYVYSLVAYYLIKDNDSTWSKAARIGRFKIKNGYEESETKDEEIWRSKGFQMFNLQGSANIKSKMNQWTKKSGEDYGPRISPLVDYIDQTPINTTTNPAPPNCRIGQQVPKFSSDNRNDDAVATGNIKTRGFYVCVDAQNVVAEVYLRGNALARIQNNNIDFNGNNKTYFPQASIRVQGNRFLFTN
jgi:prepilin-type N-terminal cleavage/methylation domain-containing protein